jgi:hypothetical protein
MTERIIILGEHDSPTQLRLATILKQLFVENQVGSIEIQTTRTWLKQLEIDANPSEFNRAAFKGTSKNPNPHCTCQNIE